MPTLLQGFSLPPQQYPHLEPAPLPITVGRQHKRRRHFDVEPRYFQAVQDVSQLPAETWHSNTVFASDSGQYYLYSGPLPLPEEVEQERQEFYIDMEVLCVAPGLYMNSVYYEPGVKMERDGYRKETLYDVLNKDGKLDHVTIFRQDKQVETTVWQQHCSQHRLACFILQAEDRDLVHYLVHYVSPPVMCRTIN